MISLFLRSESEIEKLRDRDREVKYEKNSREFSRNETLAGYCNVSCGEKHVDQNDHANDDDDSDDDEKHSWKPLMI